MDAPLLHLKPNRDSSVLRRHPWIFSGSVQEIRGAVVPGDTVEVFSAEGVWLARAAVSPTSKIRARIWTWDQSEIIDEAFFEKRLQNAIVARSRLQANESITAYRECFAESDDIPGLIVDRYGAIRVVQFLTTGVEKWKDTIVKLLHGLGDPTTIYERSDTDARERDGLSPAVGLLAGSPPPDLVQIQEKERQFLVDVLHGHKTGFYLDQRENRDRIGSLFEGKEVLDCFCYTGSFGITALLSGAKKVVGIDSSSAALELAKRNIALNDLSQERFFPTQGDVFESLREFRDRGKSFDVVILDPPRFAPTAKHVQAASRGYKDINLLALKLLVPGGVLITFSCSGGLSLDLFQKIVADAALDAGVEASIIKTLSQGADHPIKLSFPESRYLKGLICKVAG